MHISFTLNNREVAVEADPTERLVDVLRERFELRHTTAGCYAGECGTCTVLIDGDIVHSCLKPVFAVRRTNVITIEGIETTRIYRELVRGFQEAGYTPCRFCYQGKLLSLYALLEKIEAPTRAEIDEMMLAHRCRCTDYGEMTEVVKGIVIERRKRQRASLI